MQKEYISVFKLAFWNAFWITMRPYLIFVSGAAGLAGLAFIKEPNISVIILAFIPLFFSYGLGQALTDCFQIDTDTLSSPYRPLVKGIISQKQVLSVSLTGLILVVLILAYLNPLILIPGIMAVLGLLTYTKLKRTWWGGPPWNAWIVALLPIMGRLAGSNYQETDIFNFIGPNEFSFLFAVLAVFFGYANFVVMGYFKDISADREADYHTFPVTFGWQPTAVYSDICAVLAGLFTSLVLFFRDVLSIASVIVLLIAAGINLNAQIKIHLTREESSTHGPIANVVRAFILYCVAIILSLKPGWLPPVLVFYFLFEITLKLRPEKTQI